MLQYLIAISYFGAALSLDMTPTGQAVVQECVTKDNNIGFCVAYYQCNDNDTINTDGIGIIDIRVGSSVCPSYLDTCCKPTDTRETDDPIKPKPEPLRVGCGWRNPNGVGLYTSGDENGDTAKFGEFPWMIAVLQIQPINDQEPDKTFNLYKGGGSLIHPSVVLTAAHQVTEAHHYRARAGEWDTQAAREIYPYQERDVAQVLVHEKFNRNNLHYDIALLFLKSAMKLAPNVGVVCLPPPMLETPAGAKCLASGWGKDRFGREGRYQEILKKVELPVVNHKICQTQLRATRLGKYFKLNKTFMCAGGGAQDMCVGDGGSPLVCPIPLTQDRYWQSGIVAWGIDCRMKGNPGVYVDVATLRAWVDQKVASCGYDPNFYTF